MHALFTLWIHHCSISEKKLYTYVIFDKKLNLINGNVKLVQ